jgi:hypothetical protein
MSKDSSPRSRSNSTLIILAICGLLAVLAVCVTIVVVQMPRETQPGEPQALSPSAVAVSAEIEGLKDRRDRIQGITQLGLRDIQKLERIYLNGSVLNWENLTADERVVVCMYDQAMEAVPDLALCLSAVMLSDVLYQSVVKLAPDVKGSQLKPLLDTMAQHGKYLSSSASIVETLSSDVPFDGVLGKQLQRARYLNKKARLQR